MRYHHEIEWWQLMNGDSRLDQTFRHDDPWGKVRVGQDVEALPLQQDGGMTDERRRQVIWADAGIAVVRCRRARAVIAPTNVSSLADNLPAYRSRQSSYSRNEVPVHSRSSGFPRSCIDCPRRWSWPGSS